MVPCLVRFGWFFVWLGLVGLDGSLFGWVGLDGSLIGCVGLVRVVLCLVGLSWLD